MEALNLIRGLCTSRCGFHQQEWDGWLMHSGSFPTWRADAIAIPRLVWSAKVQPRAEIVRCSASAVAEPGTKTSHPRSPIPPPAHPTYDLQHVIKLALTEDAGDQGDVTCLATSPKRWNPRLSFWLKLME